MRRIFLDINSFLVKQWTIRCAFYRHNDTSFASNFRSFMFPENNSEQYTGNGISRVLQQKQRMMNKFLILYFSEGGYKINFKNYLSHKLKEYHHPLPSIFTYSDAYRFYKIHPLFRLLIRRINARSDTCIFYLTNDAYCSKYLTRMTKMIRSEQCVVIPEMRDRDATLFRKVSVNNDESSSPPQHHNILVTARHPNNRFGYIFHNNYRILLQKKNYDSIFINELDQNSLDNQIQNLFDVLT